MKSNRILLDNIRKHKVKIKCMGCGEIQVLERQNLLTGWRYHKNWVVRCPICGSRTKELK